MSVFQIRIGPLNANASLVSVIRRHTKLSIAEIRERVGTGKTLVEFQPLTASHDEDVASLTALLRELDDLGVAVNVLRGPRAISRQFLANVLASIEHQRLATSRLIDLELEPTTELTVVLTTRDPVEVAAAESALERQAIPVFIAQLPAPNGTSALQVPSLFAGEALQILTSAGIRRDA